ncbi:zinc-ribbon and DUF3426 domain-containing protein [Roseateles sp.]|uniref:zinc-ribbon and DUF3426 domain-containing protein n=1 Tax=Roseateles sp. TaxID=1971397 RepID=UPI003BAAED72
MSLATRCTACGTIFRVVEDQLRVSDGWVRCGRCAEIFDAREMLFDIERDAPPPWPPQYAPVAAPPEPLPPPPEPPAAHSPPDWLPPPQPEVRSDDLPTGWPAEPGRHEPRWVDDAPPAQPPAARTPEPRPVDVFADDEPAPDASPMPAMAAEPAEKPGKPGKVAKPDQAITPAEPVVPEFMRRAETSARWNRPRVQLALAIGALLLAALLALQVALHFRDAIAALHPGLRGPLQALCGLGGCEIQPWRRIDALSIDSTSLNPVGSGSYRLTLSLRNKTGVDVAAPWIELNLTDTTGAPFARRVLGPETTSPALTQVNAESEQTLSLLFSTGGQRVSGYSVNVFYP